MGAYIPTVTFIPHMGFHPHTRTCVWTPWSVFQDGSYSTLQANTTRKADLPAQLRGRNRDLHEFTPVPQREAEESSRPIKAMDVKVRLCGQESILEE